MGDNITTIHAILEHLDHYDSLPEDWVGEIMDDEGKLFEIGRPSSLVIRKVRKFFKMLPDYLVKETKIQDILPDFNGGLNVYWDGLNGDQLIAFFTEGGVFLFAYLDNKEKGFGNNPTGVGEAVLYLEMIEEDIKEMFTAPINKAVTDNNNDKKYGQGKEEG